MSLIVDAENARLTENNDNYNNDNSNNKYRENFVLANNGLTT